MNETSEEFRAKMYQHIETMNHEFGLIKNDMDWVKKIQWAILVGLIGLFFK